ncbi:MAG: hypothetical protein JXB62_13875 [Pirellulales bacterium]|nr:hypothetical protein [Pirellulales bacterium]
MKVRELIEVLNRFELDADVRLGVAWPDRVNETYERLWVGDYGDGPQINAAIDLKGLSIYVGCTLQRQAKDKAPRTIKLGQYDSADQAAKVRDFYIVHKKLDEPLNYPDFDYENWIPPRTSSGEYNEHIAEILKQKLLSD